MAEDISEKAEEYCITPFGNDFDFLHTHDDDKMKNELTGYLAHYLGPLADVHHYVKAIIDNCINFSLFEDEVKENNVPIIGKSDLDGADTFALRYAAFAPNINFDEFDPEYFSSIEYSRMAVEETDFNIWDTDSYNRRNDRVIRFSMPLVPYVWDITGMLEYSTLSDSQLRYFSELDLCKYDKGYMGERTRQNINKSDSIIKFRQFILIRKTEGGILWDCKAVGILRWSYFQKMALKSLTDESILGACRWLFKSISMNLKKFHDEAKVKNPEQSEGSLETNIPKVTENDVQDLNMTDVDPIPSPSPETPSLHEEQKNDIVNEDASNTAGEKVLEAEKIEYPVAESPGTKDEEKSIQKKSDNKKEGNFRFVFICCNIDVCGVGWETS